MKTLFLLLLLTVSSFAQESLNKMTKAEYFNFAKSIALEYKDDPDAMGRQAEQVIIGMAGLEKRPESHAVFKVDVVFNINSMLLLVANANKIKRSKGFIEEYKIEADGVKKQLTGDALLYHAVFTALLISENEKLP